MKFTLKRKQSEPKTDTRTMLSALLLFFISQPAADACCVSIRTYVRTTDSLSVSLARKDREREECGLCEQTSVEVAADRFYRGVGSRFAHSHTYTYTCTRFFVTSFPSPPLPSLGKGIVKNMRRWNVALNAFRNRPCWSRYDQILGFGKRRTMGDRSSREGVVARDRRHRRHEGEKRTKSKMKKKKKLKNNSAPIISESLTKKLETIKEATNRASRRFKFTKSQQKTREFQRNHGFVMSKDRKKGKEKHKVKIEPIDVVNRKIQNQSNMFKQAKKRSAAGALDVYKSAFGGVSKIAEGEGDSDGTISPNIKTINLMLSALHNSADIRDSSRAMYFWGEMEKYDLVPNSSTYSDMIRNLTKLGMVASAFDFYNERQSKGLPDAPNDPHVLLRACAKVGDFARADLFIEHHFEHWKTGSNYAVSNMVNSLLELAEGAALHGEVARLGSYNEQLVAMALRCPEENIVKWRPILNSVMKGLIMSVNCDDVECAKNMLRILKKVPSKGLTYNGLFSVIFRQDSKSVADPETTVSPVPPLLQLERGIVTSLFHLAARTGCQSLGRDAYELARAYKYELSAIEKRAMLQAALKSLDVTIGDISMKDMGFVVGEMRDIDSFTFDMNSIEDLAAPISSSLYAVDRAFYELQNMRNDRTDDLSVSSVPSELACSVIRASLTLEDRERVFETLRDWSSICSEPIAPLAIALALESTSITEKSFAERLLESRSSSRSKSKRSYDDLTSARVEMMESIDVAVRNAKEAGLGRCSLILSASIRAQARLATIESVGNFPESTGRSAIVDLLNEAEASGTPLCEASIRMTQQRASAYDWDEILHFQSPNFLFDTQGECGGLDGIVSECGVTP